jgi:putative transposase
VAHTYTNLLFHIVFSTKNRTRYLRSDVRPDVFAYIGGIARHVGGAALNIGGHDDHVHILAKLPPTLLLTDFVQKIKSNSSRWAHRKRVLPRAFEWQEGYAAFTVSESSVPDVARYIVEQETHHRKMTFQEELVSILKKHGIAYDERFLWN